MSAADALLAAVEGQAPNVIAAVVHLVEAALGGESPERIAAEAESVATLAGFRGAVAAVAEAKREELRKNTGV